MKAKNLNNSSKKTTKLIRKTFAEMLSEKRELNKVTVSELCSRAEISRGAFYSHYDDIYSVAEEYENELIDAFFDNARLYDSKNIMQFIDSIFEYIRKNHENYKLLCHSNDFLFTAKKLTAIASSKLLELCLNDEHIKNKNFVDLEIQIFIDGLFCEYVRFCRDYTTKNLDDLYEYTKFWVKNFIITHSQNLFDEN